MARLLPGHFLWEMKGFINGVFKISLELVPNRHQILKQRSCGKPTYSANIYCFVFQTRNIGICDVLADVK